MATLSVYTPMLTTGIRSPETGHGLAVTYHYGTETEKPNFLITGIGTFRVPEVLESLRPISMISNHLQASQHPLLSSTDKTSSFARFSSMCTFYKLVNIERAFQERFLQLSALRTVYNKFLTNTFLFEDQHDPFHFSGLQHLLHYIVIDDHATTVLVSRRFELCQLLERTLVLLLFSPYVFQSLTSF